MPPNKQPPLPRNHLIFDPWNTGCAGHERVQHNYTARTTEIRSVRTQQLARQFRGVVTRKPDSESLPLDYEERKRTERQQRMKNGGDIRWYMDGQSKPNIIDTNSKRTELQQDNKTEEKPEPEPESENLLPPPTTIINASTTTTTPSITPSIKADSSRRIFDSLTFFINGSTFPLISDHKLRHLVAEHGGAISISLARRSVTHVIIAAPSSLSSSGRCAAGGGGGGGGGLSAAKLQKEIATTTGRGGKGVKFVGVEWIIECVKAGKRLPEAQFVVSLEKNRKNNVNDHNNNIGLVGVSRGQRSVYGMFKGAG